jgi:hypothetical protein
MVDSLLWFGGLWAAPGLLAPALLLLAVERRWTRAWRRMGRAAPLGAYALDTAAVIAALAAVLGTALFLVATIVRAALWLFQAVTQQIQRIAADPLVLAVVLVLIAGGTLGIAWRRGWVRFPEQVRQPELGRGAATPSRTPVLAQSNATADRLPATAIRALPAPPAQDAAGGARQHNARPRPSPTMAPKPRPWMRPAGAPRQVPAARAASAPQPTAGPALAPSTGLAVSRPRPTDPSARSQPAVMLPLAEADGDEAPILAMLNQRRRRMNERVAHGNAPQQRPPLAVPAPAPLAMPRTSQRGRWHLPLGAALVLVTALAVSSVAFGIPFHTRIGELLPLQGALTSAEQQAAVNPTDNTAESIELEVPLTALAEPQAARQQVALVVADRLNVRAGPGSENPVVALVQRGDQLVLLGAEQNVDGSVWVQVRSGETAGWVNRSYITVP